MAWLNIKKRCILRWKHVVKWTHIAKNKQLLLNICYPQHMLLKGRDKRRYVTVTVSQTMNWLPSKQIKQHHLFFLSDTQALCPSIWMRFDHWILREELTIPIMFYESRECYIWHFTQYDFIYIISGKKFRIKGHQKISYSSFTRGLKLLIQYFNSWIMKIKFFFIEQLKHAIVS